MAHYAFGSNAPYGPRQALRAFLEAAPAGRSQNSEIGKGLETAAAAFPLLPTTAQRPCAQPERRKSAQPRIGRTQSSR